MRLGEGAVADCVEGSCGLCRGQTVAEAACRGRLRGLVDDGQPMGEAKIGHCQEKEDYI